MRWLLAVFLLQICSSSRAQSNDYSSVQNELIRLFSNGSHKEAYKMADSILIVLENDKHRDDSVYASIIYYATIIYGLQEDYIKPAKTTMELENVTRRRFGTDNMKYWGALYLRSLYFHRVLNYDSTIVYHKKIELLLSKLLEGPAEEYAGFEMIYKKPDMKFCLSVSLNDIGFAYGSLGKIAEADAYLKAATEIVDEEYMISRDPRSRTNFLFSFAQYLIDLERLEEAEKVFEQATQWARKVYNDNHPSYAETLIQQANFYHTTGEYEKSIKLLLNVKTILENSLQRNSIDYLITIRSLCNLYSNTNNIPETAKCIDLLQKLSGKLNKEDTISRSMNLLSQVRFMLSNGKLSSADSLLGKIEPYYIGNRDDYSPVRRGYAVMRASYHSQKKEFKEADQYYTYLLNDDLKSSGANTNSYSIAMMRKANNYFNWGMYDSAKVFILKSTAIITDVLKKNFTFFSDNQRQNYLSKSQSLFNSLYKIASASGSDELIRTCYNSQLLLKGLLLKTSVLSNRQFKMKDSLQQKLFYQYVDVRKAIVVQSSRSSSSGTLEKLKDEAEILEKKLSKLSDKNIDQQFHSKTVKDIYGSLKRGEAGVEFITYNYGDTSWLAALLITSEQNKPLIINLCSENELANLLKNKTGNHAANINLIYNGDISNSLYRLIWKPLEIHLRDIQKIYFAPSGILYQINIAALQTDDHEMILDKYQLSQLNTTSSIKNSNDYRVSASDKIVLYGGIQYDVDTSTMKKFAYNYKNNKPLIRSLPDDIERSGGFPYLPATETEVTQITELGKSKKFSIKINRGSQATEESIKALDGKASPTVLHIASHAFFFSNPTKKKETFLQETQPASVLFKQSDNPLFRSGIVFSGAANAWNGKYVNGIEDGILTSYEISNMYLSNTKLVVLSACETGLGDIRGNEGVYGLQRSFTMAGVQNLVMSLWKVPDIETSEFMTTLYENLFAGENIENSFRNTQALLKNKYRNEPYKWAAWILVR